MNKREIGKAGEDFAAAYLEQQGMRIRERNFRNRQGEIDIIGYHEGYLVFVEVKYRKGKSCGQASEAVDYRKQSQICKVADYYRYVHRIGEFTPVRYDVVAIDKNGEKSLGETDENVGIVWIQNAFSHIYGRG